MLGGAPAVEDRNLMHARNRAVRRAAFLRQVFAAHVVARVGRERDSGIAALLRAVMYQSVFADVEIARARAAAPFVRQTLGDVVLESVDASEAALVPRLHFVVDPPLFVVQRLYLAAAVVNNSDRRTEAECDSALANGQRVLRVRNSASDHGVDVHMKLGVLGQQLQLLIEDF